MLEKLYRNGTKPINKCKAVTKSTCNRCLGHNIYKDQYGKCYCLDCYQYGEIDETMTLYRFERKILETDHILRMDYNLTNLQAKGSKFLLDSYKQKQSGFLQAVCGAGKTEMTYKVILEALNELKKVCFVIPRVEVLIEVSKRFENAFPNTLITTLYEGNKSFNDAPLIFSTPQQLIYFYKEFDLIILDEVDAFPYSGNEFLERLVNKSKKDTGTILYMSATVPTKLEQKLENINRFLIPSRYHFKDMVVPKFVRINSRKNLLKKLNKYLLDNKSKSKQSLIFVPTIELSKSICEQLKPNYNCEYINSKTPYKNEVIKRFRNEELLFLVSTTVLERGVTFPNIDVFVLYADHKVFNKESLIQISGRVGRNKDSPNGKLIFFSEYLTQRMKNAKNEIIYMNCRNKEIEVQDM